MQQSDEDFEGLQILKVVLRQQHMYSPLHPTQSGNEQYKLEMTQQHAVHGLRSATSVFCLSLSCASGLVGFGIIFADV
jgi:hypothetical protein